jgi:hypothetical protein
MSATGIASQDLPWRKSTRSSNNGECVEVAALTDNVAVRDSKNPSGAVLKYSAQAWRTFLDQTRTGCA